MLGVFAQFERETIIDRVINGMERKAARGEWPGGYRYVNERIGARAIGVRLNERGLPTKASPASATAQKHAQPFTKFASPAETASDPTSESPQMEQPRT